MGRKPENPHSPLCVLRDRLTPRGQSRMSQKDFSDLIGVPIDTIKSIESKRLGLDCVLSPILWRTCAKWNGRRWVCAFDWKEETKEWIWSDGSRPFKYSVYARFNHDREERPANAAAHEQATVDKLMHLFTLVPNPEWWSLVLRSQTFIDECWRYYEGDKLQEICEFMGQQGQFESESAETYKQMYLQAYQAELTKHLTSTKRLKRGRALDKSISFHRAVSAKTPRSSDGR